MNMFNFVHLMTFLTVVSLKCGAKIQLFAELCKHFGIFCNFAPKFKYLR